MSVLGVKLAGNIRNTCLDEGIVDLLYTLSQITNRIFLTGNKEDGEILRNRLNILCLTVKTNRGKKRLIAVQCKNEAAFRIIQVFPNPFLIPGKPAVWYILMCRIKLLISSPEGKILHRFAAISCSTFFCLRRDQCKACGKRSFRFLPRTHDHCPVQSLSL